MHICAVCGKEFQGRKKSQKYCSRKCAYIGKGQREAEWRLKHGQQSTPHVRTEWVPDQEKKNYHKKRSRLDKTLAECKKQGVDYAEKQKQESIKLFAKVRVE